MNKMVNNNCSTQYLLGEYLCLLMYLKTTMHFPLTFNIYDHHNYVIVVLFPCCCCYLCAIRSGKYVYQRGTTAVLTSEQRKFEVVSQSSSKTAGEEQMDV